MHKVSRTLLLAGVMAFGTLAVACGGDTIVSNQPPVGVSSVTVSPASASIPVGTTIQLAASVSADASTAKTVTWSTSNAAVATVDQTGKVTGVSAGAVTVTATSTADASKASAAAITVTGPSTPNVPNPSIAINSVTDVNGNPVQLGNVNGQINVTVNTSGGGLIEVFLSQNCTTNTISASDVAVASQQATSAQAGTVTLSFNTAQLTATNQARFANGNYCIKTRLTNGTSVVVATNTVPLTLNNANVFKANLAFASVTGGPTSAVSSINGLNYNQGTLTATITPAIFNSTSPAALISGFLTKNGEVNGTAVSTTVPFNNVPVTSGVATIVFTDTSLAGVNSIFAYTSNANGDNLVITSATDAAGNAIQTTATTAIAGVRIDNDAPSLGTATFQVTPGVNGYVGANYSFASGTTNGGTITDTKATVDGVGGITTQYYAGTNGSAAFATANSCNITGLTAVASGSDLANSVSNTNYAAKVVVSDKLGNKVCTDITNKFGVDKIAPIIGVGAGSAANNTGYNTSAKQFIFTFSDTISGFNPAAPLQVTLVRNGFTSGAAADCVIGSYNATAKTCSKVGSTGAFSISNGSTVNGYYTVTANAIDQANPGNVSGTITSLVALDTIAPTVSGIGQSPAAVTTAGSVTVTGSAADNLDLISASGNLFYAGSGAPSFSRVSQSLGAFGGTTTSASLSLALPGIVYTGLQNGTSGTILAGGAAPQDSVQATDVGGNASASAITAIATASTKADTLTGFQYSLSSSVGTAPSSSQASTNLSAVLTGTTTNLPNQPFTSVDFYKVVSGRLVLVGSQTLGAVTDTPSSVRTWTFTLNVPLSAASTNTFYAIGRNSSGNGVVSPSVAIVNP